MKIKSQKLDNGLKIVCAETHGLNKASFTILVKAGSVYENKNNNGIFHLIEHCVFGGSKKYSSGDDIERKLNDLNIIDNVTTDEEFTKYNFSFHAKDSLEVLDFLLEILLNSIFDSCNIKKEKEIISEEIKADKNNNYTIFYSKANEILCKNTPLLFDSIGTKFSLDKLDKDDVIKIYEKYYISNNIVVSYVGSFEFDKILKKLEEYFLESKDTKLIKYPKFKLIQNKSNKRHLIKVSDNFNFISLSFPVNYSKKGDEDLAYLLKFILDEKLKKVLILKEKISYDIKVNLIEFNNFGILDVNSSFSKINKEKVIKVLEKESSNLIITKEEMNDAKNKIFSIIDFTLDDPADLSEYLAYNFSDGKLRTPEQEKKDLEKITLLKMNNFAKKVLVRNKGYLFLSDPLPL